MMTRLTNESRDYNRDQATFSLTSVGACTSNSRFPAFPLIYIGWAYMFWLGFHLIMASAAILLVVTDAPIDINWFLFSNSLMLLFLLMLSFVFPAVEEVGLHGY